MNEPTHLSQSGLQQISKAFLYTEKVVRTKAASVDSNSNKPKNVEGIGLQMITQY